MYNHLEEDEILRCAQDRQAVHSRMPMEDSEKAQTNGETSCVHGLEDPTW